MRETSHLVPRDTWLTDRASGSNDPYAAASLATEGFIHCTDGSAELGRTFDRHFGRDPRAFVALTIDLDALDVPWRFDADGSPYPHIYGTVTRAAIVGVQDVGRSASGSFTGLGVRTRPE